MWAGRGNLPDTQQLIVRELAHLDIHMAVQFPVLETLNEAGDHSFIIMPTEEYRR
jgi:hypothetical protein